MTENPNRQFKQSNGTILDLISIRHALGVTGILLVVLFTLANPEASNGLGLTARLFFWATHVGLGLGALWAASLWLGYGERLPDNTVAAIVVTGLGGIAIAAPGYLALDALFAPYIVDLDPDPPGGSVAAQLFNEVMELALWFMAAWVLINLPVLLPRSNTDSTSRQSPLDHENDSEAAAEIKTPQKNPLSGLPGIAGTDVIAVSSDLHYLNVWTAAGHTTLLGNLRDVIQELGASGMQIHRSHWVAHAHVRRVIGTSNNGACILSNDLRVPVSRRRWKQVREHYGRGVFSNNVTDATQSPNP